MIRSLLAATCAIAAVAMGAVAVTHQRRRSLLLRSGLGPPAVRPRAPRPPSTRAVAIAVAFLAAIAGSVWASPVVGAALAAGAVGIPMVIRRRRAARRAARIEAQLIEVVVAVASTLRSGRSLAQAINAAAGEVDEPLGPLLAEMVDRTVLGVPFDDVIDEWAEAVGGPDARLVAGVLGLHRQAGGAVARSLDDLARTLRGRRDAARELRSLTAQSRMSAAILGLLPLGFFLFLSMVARRDIESAYQSPVGASAIGIGLALQALAFVWIRRILRVEDA